MERSKGIVGELRHGILGVADALAQSVALLSLALGVAFASSAAAGEAGIAAPFAYLIAGVGSLCLAVVLAFTGFIGFEAAAVLGEETADPLRAIPKAILTAVVVALVYYVFVTWMMGVGYGANNAGAWAKDPAALDTLATRYVGN